MWIIVRTLETIHTLILDFFLGLPEHKEPTFACQEAEDRYRADTEKYGRRLASRGAWLIIAAILLPPFILTWLYASGSYREPTTTRLPSPSTQQQQEVASDATSSGNSASVLPQSTAPSPVPPPTQEGAANSSQSDSPPTFFANGSDTAMSDPLDPNPPELQSGTKIDDVPPARKTTSSGSHFDIPPERPKTSADLNPTEAVAQTQYFLNALAWGWNQGDTQLVAEVSSQSCETCQKVISDITRGRQAGHQVNRVSYRIGDDIAVGKGKSTGNNGTQEWHVTFTLHTSGHSIYHRFNSLAVPPQESPVHIILRKENNTWKVAGYYAAKQ